MLFFDLDFNNLVTGSVVGQVVIVLWFSLNYSPGEHLTKSYKLIDKPCQLLFKYQVQIFNWIIHFISYSLSIRRKIYKYFLLSFSKTNPWKRAR